MQLWKAAESWETSDPLVWSQYFKNLLKVRLGFSGLWRREKKKKKKQNPHASVTSIYLMLQQFPMFFFFFFALLYSCCGLKFSRFFLKVLKNHMLL